MSGNGYSVPPWAERVADSLGPGSHVVVTGISPSGNIHVGNLREVLVAEAVANALKAKGLPVRFVFHVDTADPLRKVPHSIPPWIGEYLGHSLFDVPDPEGDCHDSYAEHFLAPFEEALERLGVEVEVLRSHELYENGFYADVIQEALEHKEELREILVEVSGRTDLLVENYWSPFVPRGSSRSLHNTRVIEYLPEKHKVRFEQIRSEDGKVETREADYSKGEGKLQWRVELAARWKALQATFEPFGKDHTSRGGSTDTADRMAREVFDYPPPGRYEYEWIQIKGRGAMSSSRGIVLLPDQLLDIMPPDAVRRIVLGRDPARALDLDLAEGFPRFMDEYRADTEKEPVPFAHLVTIAQTVAGDAERAAEMLQRGGYAEAAKDPEKLRRDLLYARNWAALWAPESYKYGVRDEVPPEAAELSPDQQRYLAAIAGSLVEGMGGDAVQDLLYSTAVDLGLKPKAAFGAVYTALLGKKSGPKAGPFVAGLDAEFVRGRFRYVSGDTAA